MNPSSLLINYQELTPSVALKPFVDCYWLQSFRGNSQDESPVQCCLPYGMLEIIIHLDDNRCHVINNGNWQQLPHAFLVGICRNIYQWKSVGTSRLFGIRLKPEGLLQLFKSPAAPLFGDFTDLDIFLGKKIIRLIDQLQGIPDTPTVVQIAERFLHAQLQNVPSERSYLYDATKLIRHSQGRLSIEDLSEHLSISERQLQRSFKANFGPSPKTYLRIIRFRSAYEYISQTKTVPHWADVSYRFGYADQAHFIRDFKEFTGNVPRVQWMNQEQYFQMPHRPARLS
ncbi:helix-turn-helix transcriptional regulator [Tellurirhabdus bombi]|uniref:helix-turn-helix transcriptional regulator n=1 Tax=Tellurirhabdus bombi TaxID=2907205 RepID=UPI001F2341A5|nr:helix-turn-helix transcriptional regulator [Tellurirhabdus bombi]